MERTGWVPQTWELIPPPLVPHTSVNESEHIRMTELRQYESDRRDRKVLREQGVDNVAHKDRKHIDTHKNNTKRKSRRGRMHNLSTSRNLHTVDAQEVGIESGDEVDNHNADGGENKRNDTVKKLGNKNTATTGIYRNRRNHRTETALDFDRY